MPTTRQSTRAVRTNSVAKLESEHVRERRAMRKAGVTCNISGKDKRSADWFIDFSREAAETKAAPHAVWVKGRHGMSLELFTA